MVDSTALTWRILVGILLGGILLGLLWYSGMLVYASIRYLMRARGSTSESSPVSHVLRPSDRPGNSPSTTLPLSTLDLGGPIVPKQTSRATSNCDSSGNGTYSDEFSSNPSRTRRSRVRRQLGRLLRRISDFFIDGYLHPDVQAAAYAGGVHLPPAMGGSTFSVDSGIGAGSGSGNTMGRWSSGGQENHRAGVVQLPAVARPVAAVLPETSDCDGNSRQSSCDRCSPAQQSQSSTPSSSSASSHAPRPRRTRSRAAVLLSERPGVTGQEILSGGRRRQALDCEREETADTGVEDDLPVYEFYGRLPRYSEEVRRGRVSGRVSPLESTRG